MSKLRFWYGLLVLLIGAGVYAASESQSWQENFDSIDTKRWKVIPASAEIVPTDQLSAANRALKLNPALGQHYMTTSDKFIDGSCEIRFKAKRPSSGELFYYIGFHAYEPWVKALCWIMIQGDTVSFGVKTPDGVSRSEKLADLTDGWHTLKLHYSSDAISAEWDGEKTLTYDDPALYSSEPMPFFIGAYTVEGTKDPAELMVDYLKVTGGKPAAIMAPRTLTDAEKMVIGVDSVVAAQLPGERYAIALDGGMHWQSIDADGTEMLAPDFFAPVFGARIDGKNVFSHQFEVTGVKRSGDAFAVELLYPESATAATVSGAVKDGRFRLDLQLRNDDKQEHRLQPVFPVVGSLAVGGDFAGTEYFFPWRGGVLGDNTAYFSTEYGGLGWTQLMFVLDPASGRGLYFYPEDASGRFKGMSMIKQLIDTNVDVYHTESVIAEEVPTLDMLENRTGLVMNYYYRTETVAPGVAVEVPETVFGSWRGDWKEPMRLYADWMKSQMQPVEVPRQFRDSFTWGNWHPPAYYDKQAQRYVGRERLAGGEDALQWAFWDDYVEYPADAKIPSLQRYQLGDFEVNRSRGGMETFAAEIARIREVGTRFSVYIDHRFCWRETKTAQKYADAWAVKDPNGKPYGYTSDEDLYMMCFYDADKWVNYMAETCHGLIRDTGMDTIYLDELGIAFPCYNKLHSHYQAGEYPTDPVGLGKAMTLVRNRMKEANPEAALMTEHAGSDYLTQFYDGSWDQTFYMHAFPFTEKYYDDQKICYFRFMFPNFKLSEWGESRDHIRRSFFNGMGWDMGVTDTDLSRTLARVLKENGDAIATLHPEPIVPTGNPGLLANRFDAPGKVVYTYYNNSEAPLTAGVSEAAPFAGHYVELRHDVMLDSPAVAVPAGEVAAVALYPELLKLEADGNSRRITAPAAPNQELVICEGVDDSHFLPPRGTWTRIDFASGEAAYAPRDTNAKLIVKLLRDGYLVDEVGGGRQRLGGPGRTPIRLGVRTGPCILPDMVLSFYFISNETPRIREIFSWSLLFGVRRARQSVRWRRTARWGAMCSTAPGRC